MSKHKYIPRPGKEHFRYVGIDPCPCGDGQVINLTIEEMTQEQMQAWFDHSPSFSRKYIMRVQDNAPDDPLPQAPEDEETTESKRKKSRKKKSDNE